MAKKNTAAVAEELAQPILEEMGLLLWDVVYEKEGSGWYLRYYVDREGGIGLADCEKYQDAAMAGIPENFAGRLLEVPVGTGILTMPLYQTLPDADVTCLDYSPDMMA